MAAAGHPQPLVQTMHVSHADAGSDRRPARALRKPSPHILALVLLLACGALSRAAAQTIIPRATHAFTILTQATPRVMATNAVTTVHLTLRNDGVTTWTPGAGFHVSYHWASIRGRSVVRDGLRTELPGPVPPGGQLAIDATVQTPLTPGVYHLQWDMVQENVTWFSARDPQPPAPRTVIVVPGAGLFGAVLPPLFALFMWLAIRRSRRAGPSPAPARRALAAVPAAAASVSDVIWAAASIFGLQLLFFREAGVDIHPTALWISAVLAVVPCALLVLCCPRRWRVWLEWALVLAAGIVLLADTIYVRFFGDMISVAALQEAGQTGDVWQSVLSLLQRADLWWVAGLPFGALLARAVARLPEPGVHVRWTARGAVAAAAVLVVAGAGSSVSAANLGQDSNSLTKVFRDVWLVRDVGPLGFHAYDVWRESKARFFRRALTPAEEQDVRAWFAARAPERAGVGPWFGAARGMNVLVIQVESMQRFVVGLQVDGQEITPNLNRWRENALWFSHVTDQTNQGRTSDAEFTTMVSLLPLDQGAMAFRYPTNHYTALPAVLASHGYSTLSAVPFDGSFWNRLVTHPQYGITDNLFDDDFKPGEKVGWGLNDVDFFRQMVPRLEGLRQPFFAWFITLSLHHPFDSFPEDLKGSLKLGPWEGTVYGNYLHGMHLFDEALGALEAGLRKDGLLDRTVIVIYGDHDAGLPDYTRFDRLAGIPLEEPNPADGVPLFIRVPGAQAPRGERALAAGLTDVAPTVLALAGVDPAGLPYVGRNLLGHPGDDPIVRPYGTWVDDRHFFIPAGTRGNPGDECEDLRTGEGVPASTCAAEDAAADREAEISRRVTAYDLQTTLRDTDSSEP